MYTIFPRLYSKKIDIKRPAWYDIFTDSGGNAMQFLYMTLFALGIVGVDQFTKYLTMTNIDGVVPFIPNFLSFTYAQNDGAAWSILRGQMWLFVLIFAVMTVLVLVEYFKKPMPFTKFERWCIAAVYAGGLGNIIDRIFRGKVVDMIQLDFMDFPVFNVADCFITCGCIALFISLAFFNKNMWKDEKKF